MTSSEWQAVATFPTIFDAERAKAMLESAGIPATIRTHGGTGVFGPGFQGAVPGGAALLVGSTHVARARALVRPVAGAE